MEERVYKLTFANGESLEGLTMNGNNFVIRTKDLDDNLLSDMNLTSVTFNDGEFTWTEHNMKLIHNSHYKNGITYFTIEPKTEQELRQEEIEAKIEYIAMMTEVEF